MKKKLFALLAIVLAVSVMLSGCGYDNAAEALADTDTWYLAPNTYAYNGTAWVLPGIGGGGGGGGLWQVAGGDTELIIADSLDIQSQFIHNVLNPVLNQDAATKLYVDTADTILANADTVLTNDLATNATAINTNAAAIAVNVGNIATNTINIATNTADIASNATANANAIASNAADIASNATAIVTNAANIAANTADIASNATALATHNATTFGVHGIPADPNADMYLMWDDVPGELVWSGISGTGNVTADDNLTDNAIIRGDGGAMGVQDSAATISDAGTIYTPADINTDSDVNAGNDVNVTNDLDVTDDADIGGDLVVVGTINGEDIVAMSANIAANAADIASNASVIATNTADIASNVSAIVTNAADIASNASAIATNTANIATNTADIASNATAIATNTANIATNTADIASNATQIATNTADISSNASALSTHVADDGVHTTTTTAVVTLYVDAGAGDDGNDGTSGSPKATIQGALDALPVVIAHVCTINVRGPQNYAEGDTYLEFGRFDTLTYIAIRTVNANDEVMYDNGQADAGGANNELIDATKSWSADQFNGAYVWIYEGTGAGQIRTISDTTATKLTVSVNWAVNPDGTSYYAIGGGATLTGTDTYHVRNAGKQVRLYGFHHTGATSYDVDAGAGAVIYNYNSYHDSGVNGLRVYSDSTGYAFYNWFDGTTRGVLVQTAALSPRANVYSGMAIGCNALYMGMATFSTSAGWNSYFNACTTGISIETGSGATLASGQVFNGCGTNINPAVSTTIPQWYS